MTPTPQTATPASAALAAQIEAATGSVAPTWPLESFIAVNPYWGWREQPIADAAASLGVLAGTCLTAPRDVFRQAHGAGQLCTEDLRAALTAARASGGADEVPGLPQLLDALAPAGDLGAGSDAKSDERRATMPQRLPLITDLCDAAGSPGLGQSWTAQVTHQISQHAAAFFDRGQALWQMPTDAGLWNTWRHQLLADRGLQWPGGRAAMAARVQALPPTPVAAIEALLDNLQVPDAVRAEYLQAVLLAMSGWASWCAQLRWQSVLVGQPAAADDEPQTHLLAVRLCWEALLADSRLPLAEWRGQWAALASRREALRQHQAVDWLLQSALEFGHQRQVVDGLRGSAAAAGARPGAAADLLPAVQAMFCIDVRSEVFRRALEAVAGTALHTRGFAGFFGLPIAYTPLGGACARPQLPGLLHPTLQVSDAAKAEVEGATPASRSLGQVLAARRRRSFALATLWHDFRRAPASIFSFVESLGLAYGPRLLLDSLALARASGSGSADGTEPAFVSRLPASQPDTAALVTMAAGILKAVGLVDGFAPLVLLVGHGSQSANNAHAAGLDCGACGGQTGEVNARLLAGLLNRATVRQGLSAHGIQVPVSTRFMAALHNTTTDEVRLFDCLDTAPAPAPGLQAVQRNEMIRLQRWLEQAGTAARSERAAGLGLNSDGRATELLASLRQRASDWSQVRPEWGLADNAMLIVAPRARSRGFDLQGRSFLHDYDWRRDLDSSVLTLIMTAPMVVANWINLQYHASTLDNRRYGSGDKVLHNVVGHGVGVFEGNGGDLRIGLPLQSLHDGYRWRHTPLRLTVLIEAPREKVEAVMAQQPVVQQLVGNGWLHLLRIEDGTTKSQDAGSSPGLLVERWLPAGKRWSPVDSATLPT
ncbi:MAG: DUF2309 domain-containing protein [Rubrivivax sp.]